MVTIIQIKKKKTQTSDAQSVAHHPLTNARPCFPNPDQLPFWVTPQSI